MKPQLVCMHSNNIIVLGPGGRRFDPGPHSVIPKPLQVVPVATVFGAEALGHACHDGD